MPSEERECKLLYCHLLTHLSPTLARNLSQGSLEAQGIVTQQGVAIRSRKGLVEALGKAIVGGQRDECRCFVRAWRLYATRPSFMVCAVGSGNARTKQQSDKRRVLKVSANPSKGTGGVKNRRELPPRVWSAHEFFRAVHQREQVAPGRCW